jgi:hypothetical protein
MWQGATLQTQLPLLADQAGLGLFSIGDIALLFGGILIVAICLRRTLERRGRMCRRLMTPHKPSTTYDLALTGHPTPRRQTQKKVQGVPTLPDY